METDANQTDVSSAVTLNEGNKNEKVNRNATNSKKDNFIDLSREDSTHKLQLSDDTKLDILNRDYQETLESDLSCAICQDIYINPLMLNCSHSFCKFCVYRWLSKHTLCPQCRVVVTFQGENLALRNIINKMVQKSSPKFQEARTTNVNQRLKEEEIQEKDGTINFLQKTNFPRTARYRFISDNNVTRGSNVTNRNVSQTDSPDEVEFDSDDSPRTSLLGGLLFLSGESEDDEEDADFEVEMENSDVDHGERDDYEDEDEDEDEEDSTANENNNYDDDDESISSSSNSNSNSSSSSSSSTSSSSSGSGRIIDSPNSESRVSSDSFLSDTDPDNSRPRLFYDACISDNIYTASFSHSQAPSNRRLNCYNSPQSSSDDSDSFFLFSESALNENNESDSSEFLMTETSDSDTSTAGSTRYSDESTIEYATSCSDETDEVYF